MRRSSNLDVTPPKSARLLLHVRFFDPYPDAPLPEASAFGLRPATPPSAQNSFPHSSAHDHRGSGTEDFLTPGGVWNSQRLETVSFWGLNKESGRSEVTQSARSLVDRDSTVRLR